MDEDVSGFTQYIRPDGTLDTEPLVMAQAVLQGHEFPMPVSLLKSGRRLVSVFGRAGLMDHFRIESDPTKGQTAFEWMGRSAKSRLDEIQREFIDNRIGKAKEYQGARGT